MEGEQAEDNEAGATEAVADAADDSKEKKVQITEDTDVFQIDPESTNVVLMEKPPKPAIPKELEQIIEQSKGTIMWLLDLVGQQRHALTKQVFILYGVQSSVEQYLNHVMKLNGFFIHNDLLQAEWYYKYCKQLPGYGDYSRVLTDSPERLKVDGVPEPVCERDLRRLVDDVTNNFYAGGAHVRTQRMVCRRIERERDDRLRMCQEVSEQFPKWFDMYRAECQSEKDLADRLLEVLAYIDFLGTGYTSATLPPLDVKESLAAPTNRTV